MNKVKLIKYMWVSAVALAGISILDEYGWVVIKGLTNYNFELLLAGFILLVVTKLFKK